MILPLATTPALPTHSGHLSDPAHDEAIVSTRTVDGKLVIISRYKDSKWRLVGHPTNYAPSMQEMNFDTIPACFRAVMKAITWHYMHRGREGKKRPSPRVTYKLLSDARPFLQHLSELNISRLADVTPLACSVYVQNCKEHRQRKGSARTGLPLKSSSLSHRFGAVEALHELSQYTDDAMPMHPWPGTSSAHLAGLTGRDTGYRGGNTPLIPDDVFTALFQRAWSLIESSDELLTVRDEIAVLREAVGRKTPAESEFVRRYGWLNMWEFNRALLDLRTACYIVVASVSGCRNHELAYIESNACYSTLEADSEHGGTKRFWWMRSRSTKTGEGRTEWMVPEAAAIALKVMDHWVAPYRKILEAEIEERRAANPLDPKIAEALLHLNAVFLCLTPNKGNQVRTMSGQIFNKDLKSFAKKCGLQWDLASHQFRRKFANYAARSQFGDLRYLRSHFKHWSMDMTLGYALNESQEVALYGEIQTELEGIKADVVESWLSSDAPLAGGYGRNIVAWRGDHAVTIFKDHKQMVRSLAESTPIRSNGHAFCTAADNRCVGNDLERTRCGGGCENAVISQMHAPLYRGFLDHLQEVFDRDDIGEGGRSLVRRDMNRCQDVLDALNAQGNVVTASV
jgi:integrase